MYSYQKFEEIKGLTLHYFFLVFRCIEAALAHKKVDDVLNPDAVDREGVRDLIRGKKEVMM